MTSTEYVRRIYTYRSTQAWKQAMKSEDSTHPSQMMAEIEERAERLRKLEEQEKQIASKFFAEQLKTSDDSTKQPNQENKELYEAITIAEMFEQNETKDGDFIIKDGWDLYSIIKALVTLFRVYKSKMYTYTHNKAPVCSSHEPEQEPEQEPEPKSDVSQEKREPVPARVHVDNSVTTCASCQGMSLIERVRRKRGLQ